MTTPQEALKKIETALNTVGDLCDGNKRWTMSVPVREDDPDIVIAAALSAARAALSQQAAQEQEPVAWRVGLELFATKEEAERNIRNPNLKPEPLYAAAPSAGRAAPEGIPYRATLEFDDGKRVITGVMPDVAGDTPQASPHAGPQVEGGNP